MIPVIIKYSSSDKTPVYLFNTEDEAKTFIKKNFEQKVKYDMNSETNITQKEPESNNTHYTNASQTYQAVLNSDGAYAIVKKTSKTGEEDITEWCIGEIKNQPQKQIFALLESGDAYGIQPYESLKQARDAMREAYDKASKKSKGTHEIYDLSAWCNDGPNRTSHNWEIHNLTISL